MSCVVLALACGEATSTEVVPSTQPSAPPAPVAASPTAPPTVKVDPLPAIERFTAVEGFVGKHVLIAAGSELRVGPGDDATRLKLRAAAPGRPLAFAFEVTGGAGDRLQVRPASVEHRCDGGLPALDVVPPPGLWVGLDALVDVLGREQSLQLDDGTSVRVRVGVPVLAAGPTGAVDLSGTKLELPIDPRDVGNAFEPAVAPVPPTHAGWLAATTEIRVGERRLGAAAFHGDDVGQPIVLARTAQGDRTRVDLVGPCVSARVDVEVSALRSDHGAAAMGVLGAMFGDVTSSVKRGTAVTWADGTGAGALTRDLEVRGRGRRVKRSTCLRVAVDDAVLEPFELCVATREVEVIDPFGSSLAMGSMESALIASLDDDGAAAFASVLGRVDDDAEDLFRSGGLEDIDAALLGGVATGSRGGGVVRDAGAEGRMPSVATGGGTGAGEGPPGLDDEKATSPVIEIESFSSSGTRPMTATRASIRGRIGGLRRCAEAHTPAPSGELTLSFAIDEDGRVADVRVSGIAAIDACVRGAVERWRFSAEGEASLDLVLSFTP